MLDLLLGRRGFVELAFLVRRFVSQLILALPLAFVGLAGIELKRGSSKKASGKSKAAKSRNVALISDKRASGNSGSQGIF